MPITNAPASRASCTAAEPMPLDTELIRTRLADPQAAAAEQHVPGRPERDLQRTGLLVGDRFGHADELLGRGEHVVGEGAGAADADEHVAAQQVRHHAVAHGELVDPRPEPVHPAHGLEAQDVREGEVEPGDALTDVDVHVVQRADLDLDAHLPRAGLRVRDLLHGEHIPTTELVDPHSLHAFTSFLVAVRVPACARFGEQVQAPHSYAGHHACQAGQTATVIALAPEEVDIG